MTLFYKDVKSFGTKPLKPSEVRGVKPRHLIGETLDQITGRDDYGGQKKVSLPQTAQQYLQETIATAKERE